MYDRFGEFDSAEEINETAVNLRKEGDREGLEVLARGTGCSGRPGLGCCAGAGGTGCTCATG